MKTKRICNGFYKVELANGYRAEIDRNDEHDTTWFGQWILRIVSASGSMVSYSDPIATKKGCLLALQENIDNDSNYRIEKQKPSSKAFWDQYQ